MIRTSGSPPALLSAALLFALLLLAGLGGTASAAPGGLRLLMFDAEDCAYCERWREEIGGIYHKTAEGACAPLAVHALADGLPAGISLAGAVRFTPTFILLDAHGRELGRINGYPGEDHFWPLLADLTAPICALSSSGSNRAPGAVEAGYFDAAVTLAHDPSDSSQTYSHLIDY